MTRSNQYQRPERPHTIFSVRNTSRQSKGERVDSVDRLVMLTRWLGRGPTDTDWSEAEEKLGVALPPDYLEIAARFPVGTFQGYLDIQPYPDALADMYEQVVGGLRRQRDDTPDEAEISVREYIEVTEGRRPLEPEITYPFPLWPEPGGIYPWAEGGWDATFFWLQTTSDPSSWPVVWCHGEDILWERFDGTASEFLIALVTGQIDVRRLGSPIFPPPPRFDEWQPYVPIPRAR